VPKALQEALPFESKPKLDAPKVIYIHTDMDRKIDIDRYFRV